MKNIIFFLFAISSFLTVKSQDSAITINEKRVKNGLELYVVNKTTVRQEIVLELTVTNLKGYKGPITKLVNANDSILMAQLNYEQGTKWNYKYSFNYLSKPTEAEIALQDEELKKNTLAKFEEYKEGIVLFYKDGCSRCSFVTLYMLEHGINFKLLDVTSDEENDQLMWDMIKFENPDIARITMPVFLINGKFSYNIENLKNFSKASLKPFK
jgi:glutaredoxin